MENINKEKVNLEEQQKKQEEQLELLGSCSLSEEEINEILKESALYKDFKEEEIKEHIRTIKNSAKNN